MDVSSAKCCFCKSDCKYWSVPSTENFFGFDCPICKLYFITNTVFQSLSKRPLDSVLAECISDNIRHNTTFLPILTSWHSTKESTLPKLDPEIVVKRFEHYESRGVIHAEKSFEVLKIIASRVGKQSPFTLVKLVESDQYLVKVISRPEMVQWLTELMEEGLITSNRLKANNRSIGKNPEHTPIDNYDIQITPKGWRFIAERGHHQLSNNSFIAMSFGLKERNEIEAAIRDACREAGWQASTVDRNEYTGGVVDKIIASINESKFVVADLTGHRNGVYFEAGYALGRGMQVILTIKDDPEETKNTHFDIQHLNQIRWKDTEDLKEKLLNRIKAIFPKT